MTAESDSALRLDRLGRSVGFRFFHRFHCHQKLLDDLTTTREIQISEIPQIKFPKGVRTPEKGDGKTPANFSCPILTDFINLNRAGLLPQKFLDDVDVFTTVAALRSLLCQWVDASSSKSQLFRTQRHYCELDDGGRLYLNSATSYTVPFEKSPAFLNRYAILDHQMTWNEYIATTYSGLAKIKLANGIRVAFTFKVYARDETDRPVDILTRRAGVFEKEADFHFVNTFLTRKTIRRYERSRTGIRFEEELSASDIWEKMPRGKQERILEVFETKLPNFLCHVAEGIRREEQLNVVESVTAEGLNVIPIYQGCHLW